MALIIALALPACSDPGEPLPGPSGDVPAPFDQSEPYDPDVVMGELSPAIDNPYFPAPVGATWTYDAYTDDGVEHIEIEVLEQTREVDGASARVVRDTVYFDGELIEDTWDWYGQDADGSVWYLGEDTYEYENGKIVCSCGAWESGVAGALPGIIMLAAPQPGDVYRQEYLRDEAEDIAQVISTAETVTVPAGTFTNCIKTRDRSAIDLKADAYKYYCPGIGVVLEEEGGERVELVEVTGL